MCTAAAAFDEGQLQEFLQVLTEHITTSGGIPVLLHDVVGYPSQPPLPENGFNRCHNIQQAAAATGTSLLRVTCCGQVGGWDLRLFVAQRHTDGCHSTAGLETADNIAAGAVEAASSVVGCVWTVMVSQQRLSWAAP